MDIVRKRPFGQNYAFVVVGVVFLALLAAAGMRSAPGVLLQPLEQAFGWSRSVTSFSAGLGIFLYGMVGPFAAALMQTFGIRRTLISALVLMSVATAASAFMTEPWHLVVTWGVLSGLGTGCVAMVLGATVVNRWFATNRGLIMGIFAASTATGTLIFMPGLAAPADAGLAPYGAMAGPQSAAPASGGDPLAAAFGALARAVRKRDFWFLFATFFVCGFTTNGLVGTHLIALCGDHGIAEMQAASLLALMGFFDLFGTTASGWLTDRIDPRKLLFVYYGARGLSLIYLPFSDFSLYSLSIFAVFYGLDWIATVPPTLRLTTDTVSEREAPVVFGWI